ncbi:MAG: hypothetical protein JXA20_19760 [Spirochaetes bacterium]|nr:hypothetical protein [Spirochaetota bacterium]
MTRPERSDSDPLEQATTDASPGNGEPVGFNILRKKTFNEELRRLIHRIEDHESERPSAVEEGRRLHEITEEELIKRFHRLHYRIDNIGEHMQSHSAFNPFRLAGPENPLSEQILAREMGSILLRMGYESYAVLVYRMPDHCFRPFVNGISLLPDDDFILALDDPLYHKIAAAAHGAVLDKSDFTGGAFLKRTLDLSEFRDDRVILAVQCRTLTSGILGELSLAGEAARDGYIPSPLLLLYYDPKRFTENPLKRIESLAGALAVPLLLLLDRASRPGTPEEPGEAALEQLIHLFFVKGTHRFVLVRCSADDVSGYFLMKYLYEKLIRTLGPDNSIQLVRPRILVLIIADEIMRRVQETIDHWSELMNNEFVFSVYNKQDYHHPMDLLKIILLNI